MAVEIRKIAAEKKQLRHYTKFGISLYKDNDCYVPPLIMDDVATLDPKKNPAFENCEAQSWMAYRDGKPVGRITGIINRLVNSRTGLKDVRFGFVDFIDDDEVAEALFDTVAQWGREHGMDSIVGPLGFTDLDHEGMLTFGFDEPGTMATIYNYPYYPEHMKRMGFEPDAEWVEFRISIPDSVPDRLKRVSDIVTAKLDLHTKKYKSSKKLKADYGVALFDLFNRTYDKLYGYSPLTPRQIQYYIDQYLPMLRLKNLSIIVDADDKLVGVGITMPSMSRALQKSGGHLFPTGWWHLLKGLYGKNDMVDLLMVAVAPEYQNKGVNSMLFTDLVPIFVDSGYKWAESNLELADNQSVQQQWKFFEHRLHKRRCTFRKKIE